MLKRIKSGQRNISYSILQIGINLLISMLSRVRKFYRYVVSFAFDMLYCYRKCSKMGLGVSRLFCCELFFVKGCVL